MSEDIRWKQRFENYKKAVLLLNNAVETYFERELSELEKQGLIQRFEFTHELAWKLMKDFLNFQGNTPINGSRDATREAFSLELIVDGDGWMKMITSRNESSHTYNETISNKILDDIVEIYNDLFLAFNDKMQTLV